MKLTQIKHLSQPQTFQAVFFRQILGNKYQIHQTLGGPFIAILANSGHLLGQAGTNLLLILVLARKVRTDKIQLYFSVHMKTETTCNIIIERGNETKIKPYQVYFSRILFITFLSQSKYNIVVQYH